MKFIGLLFFIIWGIAPLHSEAQNQKKLDSLYKLCSTNKIDTTHILAFLSISQEYRHFKKDSSMWFAENALRLSESIGFVRGKARAVVYIGHVYFESHDYAKALTYYEKGVQQCKHTRQDKLTAIALSNIGRIYEKQGKYKMSLEKHYESLKINEKIENKKGIAVSMNNIGMIYEKEGMLDKALEHYQKSLEIDRQTNNEEGIGLSYVNLGVIAQKQKKLNQAIEYYEKASQILEKTPKQFGLVAALNNMVSIYVDKEEYEKTTEIYTKILQINQKTNNQIDITRTLYNLAYFYLKQERYAEAMCQAEKGLQIAEKIGLIYEKNLLNATIYQIHKAQGDFENALAYHEKYKIINDTLYNIEKSKAIHNLEAKIQLERKDKELAYFAKDNEIQKINTEKKAKELEAEQMQHLATIEKDKRKADSLFLLAKYARLEADKMRILEAKLKAENKNKALHIEKMQTIIIVATVFTLLLVLFLAYIYKNKTLIQKQKDEIEALNQNLEEMVQQRTQKIELRNKQLREYAFYNAHVLRRPIANILGLYQLYETESIDSEKEQLLKHLDTAVKDLDTVVHQMQEVVAD